MENKNRTKNLVETPAAIACILVSFIFYSIVISYRTPQLVDEQSLLTTINLVSKSISALLITLGIIRFGISFRSLISIWGVFVALFAATSVLLQIVQMPLVLYVYYIVLGLADAIGIIVLASLLAQFLWNTSKWIIVSQHLISRLFPPILYSLDVTDRKVIGTTFILALALMVVISILVMQPKLSAGIQQLNIPRIIKKPPMPTFVIAIAIGGATISPFLLGLMEPIVSGTMSYTTDSIWLYSAINIGIVVVFMISFLFKRPIGIQASFLVISILSFISLIWALLDSSSPLTLMLILQTSVIFYYLALWFFVFKTGSEGIIHPSISMGIVVFIGSFSRTCGNLLSFVALDFSDILVPVESISVGALAFLALLNFCLLIVSMVVQRFKEQPSATGDMSTPLSQSPVNEKLEGLASEYSLSFREQQVLQEYILGRSVPAIAQKHYLSQHTVKGYIARAYAKLNVHSRQELQDLVDTFTYSNSN
ncbi:MAG: LuxR C-terminal-related transcriptional regulator [Coriobacteriales bacterium]|jgi:DNA-binding CsgD family transcriptional regulator|nr:LuxR C-terminal-related transcriptional regulator [Coriobacteriales bacterium]